MREIEGEVQLVFGSVQVLQIEGDTPSRTRSNSSHYIQPRFLYLPRVLLVRWNPS